MIEMRTEQDVGVLEARVAAFDQADDVVRGLLRDDFVGLIDGDGDFRGEGERRLRLAFFCPGLDVGEAGAAAGEERVEERLVAGELWRNQTVNALDRREI